MNEAKEQARLVAEKIIKRLAADISDRAGLGDEWTQIDDKTMTEELLPAWEQIIVKEMTKARRPRSSVDKALDCIELWMNADVELFKDAPFHKNLKHRLRTVRALRRILQRPPNDGTQRPG